MPGMKASALLPLGQNVRAQARGDDAHRHEVRNPGPPEGAEAGRRQANASSGCRSMDPRGCDGRGRRAALQALPPPDVKFSERLPLMVMLHGCGQDANTFAASTRMNRIAMRERFLVLYPEQDRLANGHGCWNWFDTRTGRAHGESALIMKAIDQVCLLYPVDRTRVAIAGLSAGASMAALLATRHPGRFKAVVMHRASRRERRTPPCRRWAPCMVTGLPGRSRPRRSRWRPVGLRCW